MKNLFVLLFSAIMFFGIVGCPENESTTRFVETSIVKKPVTSPDSGSVPINGGTSSSTTSPDSGSVPINGGTSSNAGTHSPVPEPTTLLLLGSGLVGVAALGRKRFKR